MDRLRVKATECKYKEVDRRLKEQFSNGITDQTITAEIIRGLESYPHMGNSSPSETTIYRSKIT